MAGKTNTKQICVFKTKKALLEFMDDTRYESEPMAWPHSPMSRIRINAKDYSKGTGDLAVDAFYNLSPEEFHRMQTSILKAKQLTINDFNRSNKHLERLMTPGAEPIDCERPFIPQRMAKSMNMSTEGIMFWNIPSAAMRKFTMAETKSPVAMKRRMLQ